MTRARDLTLVVGYAGSGKSTMLVVGYAGSGKSTMLGVARRAWAAEGYRVRGAALSGVAAEGLEAGSGIECRTIASLEYAWGQGKELLEAREVLVVDEAGMVGSRQMERLLSQARAAGAKVVLVGDPEQLQAIEAGAAFRALAERHGAAEITEVRRQRAEWQRQATRELATGRYSGGAAALWGSRHGAALRHARGGSRGAGHGLETLQQTKAVMADLTGACASRMSSGDGWRWRARLARLSACCCGSC